MTAPRGLDDLPSDRALVMGVVNVTPDSFSDGGLWYDPEAAVARGVQLLGEGADLLDVGGESTRPGAARVPVEEELRRVVPVVAELAADGAVVSVDTMRAEVAERALEAGARLVNDVSGGLADDAMAPLVAATGAPFVVMHWRGHSDGMDALATYDDVVADVRTELLARVDALVRQGVDVEQLVLDPGLGFAKSAEHNWSLLGHLEEVVALGRPVLVAASRKRFLGHLLAGTVPGGEGEPVPPVERDDASAAVTALAAAAGAWCIRVHESLASWSAVRVAAAWTAARGRG